MSYQNALEIFYAGVAAVKPSVFLPKTLTIADGGIRIDSMRFSDGDVRNIYVAGAGKASAAMALEMEKILSNRISEGIVVTKYDHQVPLQKITCYEAAHPVPDQNGIEATQKIVQLIRQAGKNDLIIFLISGGASVLLADYPPGCSLADLKKMNSLLLNCGATIHEINTIRKHVSLIKGGQILHHVNGAKVVALIISDVPGDDLSAIASGLTVADPTTFSEALAIIHKYKLRREFPPRMLQWLSDGEEGKISETPKIGDEIFLQTHNFLLATNRHAIDAAKLKATQLGYEVFIINDHLQGEAKVKAKEMFEYIHKTKVQGPTCFLMGGETTVTIKGNGKGGRNQEFALAALCEMGKNSDLECVILSGGTDGTDGPTDATGALASSDILKKAHELNMNPLKFLENNDAYHFFLETGGLIKTGPTQTNVMDIVVGIVE